MLNENHQQIIPRNSFGKLLKVVYTGYVGLHRESKKYYICTSHPLFLRMPQGAPIFRKITNFGKKTAQQLICFW